MDLPALRQRAFQHIISQLTVQNIPYEVFSQFSATYEDVRQVCQHLVESSLPRIQSVDFVTLRLR